jgi:YD repeat-containing protein
VAPVPTGATTGNVLVVVAGIGSNGVLFTVTATAVPAVASLSPTSGTVGASVTISGNNFGATQGTSTVTFNGTAALPTSWSATSIVAPVPTGATTGNVVVTVGGLASNGVTFTVNPGTPPVPSITSLSPTSGPVGSGLAIFGSNFGASQSTSTVTVTGITAAPTLWSADEIVVTVPMGATTGNVVVTVGGQGSNPVLFTVGLVPNIIGLSPTSGAVDSMVYISGTNFGTTQGTSTVAFNGVPATAVFWSSTSVQAQVPTNATTGNVVVTVGGLASNGSSFTVTSGPGIASLSPVMGPIGTSVTITGKNFGATQGASTVSFNGTNAIPTSWSDTSVVVPVPSAATTGGVFVQVGASYSNSVWFTVGAPPSIASASPNSGPIGMPVTISGTGFGASPASSTLTFNGIPATAIISWTDTSIVVPVPKGAASGNVIATVGGTASNGTNFTVTSGPGISSISPTSGPTGTSVTITGNNFGTYQGSGTITFAGAAGSVRTWTDTSITALVPANTSTGNVVVTSGGVVSNGIPFTLVTAPTIYYLNPTSGAVASAVTINGANFGATQGTSTVTFNGTTATPISWSATSIVVSVPSGATTGNVVVTVGGLQASFSNFTVTAGPGITSASPNWGSVGTVVTITGSGFGATQGSSTVMFYGVTATPTAWSTTQIVVPVPNQAQSGQITVSVGGAFANAQFTVTGQPNLTSLVPTSGPVGSAFTINGTNLSGNVTLTLNGTSTGPFQSTSATSVSLVVPQGATSGNVVISKGGGAVSNSLPFTVTAGPGLNTISPITGAVGALISIFGGGFGSPQGTSTVTFNGRPATTTLWSDNTIYVSVPTGATSGNVVATVGGIASNSIPFTVTAPATITSVAPTFGGGGSLVTISGTNFGGAHTGSVASFSGGPLTIKTWSDTVIQAQAPSFNKIIIGPVTVTTSSSNVASNSVTFTVFPSPVVSALSPTTGSVGTIVTITGSGFGSTQAASTVTFNGGLGVPTSWSDTTITVPVPLTGSAGPVIVTVNGAPSTGSTFGITPVINSVSPVSGVTNAAVTVTGSGFGTSNGSGIGCQSRITFNGTLAHPSNWTTNTLVVPVPNLATTGPVVVTVVDPSSCVLTNSNGVIFTVPVSSTVAGTVTGAADGKPIVGITIQALQSGVVQGSATTALNGSYSIGSLAPGTYDIQTSGTGYVTALKSGTAVTANSTTSVNFSLGAAPALTGISPTWGPVGTTVTISGLNFGSSQMASTVSFNGRAAPPATWGPTIITVQVPTGATSGSVQITVGGIASNTIAFQVGSGTISGTVTSAASGSGVNGALVEILQSNVVQTSTTSGTGGTYSIPSLPPGMYDVRTSAAGFGTLLSLHQNVSVGSTTTVNVSLPAPGTDSGHVTNASGGASLPGVAITAVQTGDTVSGATTDSSGNFSISNLSPGTYGIVAALNGFTTQTQSPVNITANSTATTNFSLAGQSTIIYEYDALGRLAGVTDSQNGTATYNYDAVGNITSITRPSLAQVTIISLVPNSGPVGSTVTINGTNFSSTAGQNSVTFNGTAGTVISATPTKLITTVPTGATPGTVAVTAPAGSATSSGSFTVTTTNLPTITSFTPAIGLAGGTVSLSGNFDPILLNDKLLLNNAQALVGSTSTSTTLATTVPVLQATSGRFTVATPAGQAVSSSDFYVVPAPHQVTDVGFTGRTQINATASLVPLSANQIGLLLFDGTAGQRITLFATNNTYGCSLAWQILAPDGTSLNNSGCLGGQSWPLGPIQLSQTGTYTLYLSATSTGQVNVAVSSVLADITGALFPGGPTVGPLSLTTPGQQYLLTFNGTAGRRISFLTTNGTFPNCGSLGMVILNPDRTTLVPNICAGTTGFTGAVALTQTGTYLIQMASSNNATGGVSVTLYDVPPDITTSTTIGASPLGVSIGTPGQRAFVTFFSGTSGTLATVHITSNTIGNTSVVLLNPDATTLTSSTSPAASFNLTQKTLTQTGTYTIQINPSGSNTGSLNLQVTSP